MGQYVLLAIVTVKGIESSNLLSRWGKNSSSPTDGRIDVFYYDASKTSFINGTMKAKDRDEWWSILLETKA